MLLNLTNHPYINWPEDQKEAAIRLFGSVTDFPHPDIDPAASTDRVLKPAEGWFAKIQNIDSKAVHLMGEMTFCNALIPIRK